MTHAPLNSPLKSYCYSYRSPVGMLYLVASDQGLNQLSTEKPTNVESIKTLVGNLPALRVLKKTVIQLEEYFDGKRKNFEIPLDMEGTEFQSRVWKNLCLIPFGKTISYKKLAQMVKNPKASRAVGNANGKNPICIIVPCHRVIAADGAIGGYSSGLPMKKFLLALENKKSLNV